MVKITHQLANSEVAFGKDFTLKFGVPKHEIDINTLAGVLISSTDILQELNKEIDPSKKLEIKIHSLAPGSFLVHIELNLTLIQGLASLFTIENATYAGAILSAFVNVLDIHKFLKGDTGSVESSNDGKLLVKNNEGVINYVDNSTYNIYINNPKIGPALSKNFEALNCNPEVSEFKVLDANQNALVEIDRVEFEELTRYNVPKEKNTNVYVQPAKLRISFDPNHRWAFIWKEKRINAIIADPDFNQKVKDGGGRYASGDLLSADLEVTQIYDPNYDTFVNNSYRILKVTGHTPNPEQQNIF